MEANKLYFKGIFKLPLLSRLMVTGHKAIACRW